MATLAFGFGVYSGFWSLHIPWGNFPAFSFWCGLFDLLPVQAVKNHFWFSLSGKGYLECVTSQVDVESY